MTPTMTPAINPALEPSEEDGTKTGVVVSLVTVVRRVVVVVRVVVVIVVTVEGAWVVRVVRSMQLPREQTPPLPSIKQDVPSSKAAPAIQVPEKQRPVEEQGLEMHKAPSADPTHDVTTPALVLLVEIVDDAVEADAAVVETARQDP